MTCSDVRSIRYLGHSWHTVAPASYEQEECCILWAIHRGSHCTQNLEAFPIACRIAHTTFDVKGFSLKDNNMLASCEATKQFGCTIWPQEPMIHMPSNPQGLVYMLQNLTSLIHPGTHGHNNEGVTRGITIWNGTTITQGIHLWVL